MRTFEELRRNRNHFTFVWAITHLFGKGIDACKEMTDEYIENAYQNEIERQKAKYDENSFCLYTPEVVRDMLLTARELANMDFTELMNGIQKADLWKARKISYDRMNEIASRVIDRLIEDDEYEAKEYLKYEVELDDEEQEWFGVNLDESEDEGDK